MLSKLWFCWIKREHAYRRARKGEPKLHKTCVRCGAVAIVKQRKARVVAI